MKTILYIFTILISGHLFAQNKKPEDYGFRHLQTTFQKDTIDILIKSKKGDENKSKPIFLFCQGSQPQPLIKYNEQRTYGVFPFRTDSLENNFHIVIISKPFVPVIADTKNLSKEMCVKDPETGKFPKKYSDRNYLDYYVFAKTTFYQFKKTGCGRTFRRK
jgi:hypothetical protein